MHSSQPHRRRLASLLILLAPAMASAVGVTPSNTILIDGVGNSASAIDKTIAESLGFTTEVVTDAAVWNAKTTADFATYKAIVLPDNYCDGPSSTALDSAAVWAPAVTGNVLLIGGDPELHSGGAPGGPTSLLTNGIGFAAADTGHTGLMYALGCGLPDMTALNQFGSFTVGGFGSDSIHIVAVHPALSGLTDALLSNWGSSTHLKFEAFPENFVPLAIQLDGTNPGIMSFADGTSGTPFLLVRGSGVQPVGLNVSASAAATVEAGSPLTYTITYGNTGSAATGVVLTAPVPAGTTFVSATGGGALASGVVTWAIGDVAAGTSGQTVTFTVTPAAAGTTTASNITITDGTHSAVAADVVTTVTAPPVPVLGIVIDATATGLTGSNLVYTLTYGNLGADATGVVIHAPVPNRSSFVSATGGGTLESGVVTWNVGTLAGGTTGQSVTFTVHLDTAGEVTASAVEITDGTHSATASSVTTAVTDPPVPGLNVVASAAATGTAGDDLVYTLTYGNTGTAGATGVTLTAPVPTGTTFVSATGGGTAAGGVVTWTIGDLASGVTGQSVSFTVHLGTVGTITASGITLTDGTHGATAAEVDTVVSAAPVPGLTLTAAAAATGTVGTQLVYTLTYGNTGTAGATGVVLTAPVPVGTTFVSATGGGTAADGVVTWNVGALASGTTGQTVTFTVSLDVAGTVTAANMELSDGTHTANATSVVTTVSARKSSDGGCNCGSGNSVASSALLALFLLALLPRRRSSQR
jgi:uncharacterized repeat protein (TIGR01451 family)/MYXO-CTERM domain-containing protein